jgi:phosphate transport system substrate-binding protein
VVAAAAQSWGAGAEGDLAVVVHKSNTVENVSEAQLCKLLMGQATWSSGKPAHVLLMASGPERDGVIRIVCSMTAIEFMQHLLHGGTAPKALSSMASIKQLLATLPGAIGFLPVSEVTDSVRVVKLDGRTPGEAGYKLHLN